MTRTLEQKDGLLKKEFEEKQRLEAQMNDMDLNVENLNQTLKEYETKFKKLQEDYLQKSS